MYSSFQVMYTVGYCLSLGALLLALAILLGLRYGPRPGRVGAGHAGRRALTGCPRSKLHCARNYIHVNLFASFVLKASSVLVIDTLLKTRYSQQIGDDLSVSVWLSDGVRAPPPAPGPWVAGGCATSLTRAARGQALAGCRVAAVFMQYGVVANYCWLLVEGVYLHSLLGLATFPERSFFSLYLGVGWGEWAPAAAGGQAGGAWRPQLPPPAGAPMLFVIPWAVVKCLFENIQ